MAYLTTDQNEKKTEYAVRCINARRAIATAFPGREGGLGEPREAEGGLSEPRAFSQRSTVPDRAREIAKATLTADSCCDEYITISGGIGADQGNTRRWIMD